MNHNLCHDNLIVHFLPDKHDEAVEAIPRLAQIAVLSLQPERKYLHTHLDGEEEVDHMINVLHPAALWRVTVVSGTGLKHAHSYTVDNDDEHADLLEVGRGYDLQEPVADRIVLADMVKGHRRNAWEW